MKKLLPLLAVITLLSCQNNPAVAPSKFKTMMLRSSGQVEVLPDMATFSINLNCLSKSAKSSKQCLVEKSNALHDQLLAFGIDEKDLLTTSVDLRKSYRWQNGTNVFEGYSSSSSLHVTVRNLDKLDEIYTELLEIRNLDLRGLQYSHTALDSLNNVAYQNALENANVLSDKLLEKLPETKKEVLKVGNVELSSSLPNNQNEYKAEEMGYNANVRKSNVSISTGTVLVHATLYVEYQIK